VLVVIIVGRLEPLRLVQGELKLSGTFWDPIAAPNNSFGMLGYANIVIFIASWMISAVL
jgi:high-affinity nickel-transport protein